MQMWQGNKNAKKKTVNSNNKINTKENLSWKKSSIAQQ